MSKNMNPAVLRQLELDVAAIDRDHVPARPPVVYQKDLPPSSEDAREPFGRWLLAQRDRGDWIDNLAMAARTDRAFPRDGDIADVHARLILSGADPEMFEQLDDAERCWRSQ